jgi:hypothetical protein
VDNEAKPMLSDEERAVVQAGAVAKRLVEYPEWKSFVESIQALRATQVVAALQPGDTTYIKGIIVGLDLVMRSPQDTIEQREEILAREQRLGQLGEGDEVTESEERVP